MAQFLGLRQGWQDRAVQDGKYWRTNCPAARCCCSFVPEIPTILQGYQKKGLILPSSSFPLKISWSIQSLQSEAGKQLHGKRHPILNCNCLPQVPISFHWLTKKFTKPAQAAALTYRWIELGELDPLQVVQQSQGVTVVHRPFLQGLQRLQKVLAKVWSVPAPGELAPLITIQQTVNCTLSSFLINISRSGKCCYNAIF